MSERQSVPVRPGPLIEEPAPDRFLVRFEIVIMWVIALILSAAACAVIWQLAAIVNWWMA